MQREESLEQLVERRNKRLLRFFTEHGFEVRLVGDSQKPAVILNEIVVLSCYVKNFDLHFTKEPFGTDIVKSFKLKSESEASRYDIQEAIELCTHRPVFKIKLSGTDLFLTGYNYQNSEEAMGRYPVFAKHKPKVYFDREFAEKMIDSLGKEDYSLEIV